LLTKEFGKDFAGKVLDAHEMESTQPEREKLMDNHNNSIGTAHALSNPNGEACSQDELMKEFDLQLKSGKVKVLKPRSPEAGGGKK